VLRLSLDYAAHLAQVDERITYTNQSGTTLDELVLAVEPGLWPGAFTLTSLSIDGQPSGADLDGQRMTVKPAQPLAAGRSVSLEMSYKLRIPSENRRYLFGYNAQQTNLLDWYPFIVPYAPDGWVLHEPGPAGEHLVYESADFDVSLRFANTSAPPRVAASAPGIPKGEWTDYHLQGARGFSLSASENFLTSTAQAGGVLVTSYYFDGHQAAGTQAANITAQAVQLFSEKFAPYPYETLSVVESASADGMESDGLFFMAGSFYATYDGTLQNYLTTLSVHETGHQWWYGLVGSDQALEPWLDEALATYAERIFYRENYPDLVNWWWNFRIRRFNPTGSMNSSIYTNGAFRPYTNAVYFMGAYWLEDLRVRIGDEAFYAALSDYAKRNAHRIATADLFFAVLNEHTNTDYSDIVNQYFR
jgi:aminopeptidase N